MDLLPADKMSYKVLGPWVLPVARVRSDEANGAQAFTVR
jgi:hypothetical protein